MVALLYKDDHNKIAYLEKGKGWEPYEQILDFLNRSHIRSALTHHLPIVFDSLVKQFWATATATVRTLEAGLQRSLPPSMVGSPKAAGWRRFDHGRTVELASPEQAATGKDISNPSMAVMVCQKPLGYFSSPMFHVPRAGLVIHPPGPNVAVFGVPAGCSCWFPYSCWFLVAAVWLFTAVLFRSTCWNNDTILELTSEDLSRILKLMLSNSRLGEDCWELQN
nr:hypothetical protein [Tanacetum cinerariifolium]